MTRMTGAASAAAIAALALTGCQGGSAVADDPVIWYVWTTDMPAMQALLTATMTMTDGCITAEDGSLLAFPRTLGTWNDGDGTLEYQGATYAPGDTITAGGGGGSITEDMAVPEACNAVVGDPVWLIQDTSLGG